MRCRTFTNIRISTLQPFLWMHQKIEDNLRSDRDVTAVNNLGPGIEWVRRKRDIVSATKSDSA
jgi:hypothetical protein